MLVHIKKDHHLCLFLKNSTFVPYQEEVIEFNRLIKAFYFWFEANENNGKWNKYHFKKKTKNK